MPYLSVELDARRKAAMIANGLGLHPGVVMWGLEELWEISWRMKTDTTTPVGLAGCFGPDVERMMPALLVHGFLEPLDGGAYRVRGASRYLRIRAAQSAAGHAAKGNLRRGRGAGTGERASPGGAGEAPGSISGSAPALASSSEQRASNTSESTPLAGAVAPAGRPPGGVDLQLNGKSGPKVAQPAVTSGQGHSAVEAPRGGPQSTPSQTPTPPAKDAQEPAQAPERPTLEDLADETPDAVEAMRREWNRLTTPPIPRWDTTGDVRRKRAKAALGRRPLAQWREVFSKVEADPFMRGDNDRGWVAGIDYVLRAPGAKQEPAEAILARVSPRTAQSAAPACEVCGSECRRQEHGRNLCESCRHRFRGERIEAGWRWTPEVTAEQERAAVAAWIEKQSTKSGRVC